MQRTLAGGLVAGLVVGVAAGHAISCWFGRCDAAPADAAAVDLDASSWRFTSFEVPVRPVRAEIVAVEPSPRPDFPLLGARAAELELEVGRLSAALERADPRRGRIARLVAANELRHADLYREVAELVLLDPESVTEDPSDLFSLIVRLADESGLAATRAVDQHKELAPEREAPELHLVLGSGAEEGAEWIRFSAVLTLPKVPAEWRGSPLDLHVALHLQRGRNGEASVLLSARGDSFENRNGLECGASWNRDSTQIRRCPRNGGEDDQKGGPSDFASFRAAVDDLFEKLKSRAR